MVPACGPVQPICGVRRRATADPYRSRRRMSCRRSRACARPSRALRRGHERPQGNDEEKRARRAQVISGRVSACISRMRSITTGEYCAPACRSARRARAGRAATDIDVYDVFVAVVPHLERHQRSTDAPCAVARTSAESVELPQPSMRMRALLSGTSSRTSGATSAYDLNQSNDAPAASLRARRGAQDVQPWAVRAH
jgi:hypothetical protein